MTKYRTIMREVEAVQWQPGTAGSLAEVRELCPEADTVDSGWTLRIPIPVSKRFMGARDYLVAHAGYYVVRINDVCMPMAPDTFAKNYEPAGAGSIPAAAKVATAPDPA